MHQTTQTGLNDVVDAMERNTREDFGVFRLLRELGQSALFVPYSRTR
ncbi:hypothetical protein [Marinovum sp.]